MLTMVGSVGEYVSSLPVVITATLAVSYFVAMLVTPIMCLWLLRVEDTGDSRPSPRIASWLARYDMGIRWCLTRPGEIVAAAGAVFASSLLLLPVIGSQFCLPGGRGASWPCWECCPWAA